MRDLAALERTETPSRGSRIVEKAWDLQRRIERRVGEIGRGKYARVVRMARKPTPEEYRKASLVSAAGILLVGAIGFLVYLFFLALRSTGIIP